MHSIVKESAWVWSDRLEPLSGSYGVCLGTKTRDETAPTVTTASRPIKESGLGVVTRFGALPGRHTGVYFGIKHTTKQRRSRAV